MSSASFMPIPLPAVHAVAASPEESSISVSRSANRKGPSVPLASTPRRRPHHPACQPTRIPASPAHEPLHDLASEVPPGPTHGRASERHRNHCITTLDSGSTVPHGC
ncbi:hypothetical protein VE04_09180, partial [Pseudogymnoascus sp. 24MN13]